VTVAQKLIGLQRGFSPLSITGLVAWYDFSDAASLFTDTARTTPVASDTDVIKGVTDKSGNAKHLSEATNGPAYKLALQNGKSGALFDGTNDLLTSAAITQAQPNTILLVGRIVVDEAGSSTELVDGTGSRQIIYKDVSSAKWSFYAGTAITAGNITADTSYHVHYVVFNGASSVYRLDRAAEFASVNPNTGSLSPIVFGTDATRFYNTEIGEFLMYNSALSSTDRDSLEAALKAKWGTP